MNMTDIEYRISDLINFSSNQKPIEFEQAFNSIMVDRIQNAVDDRKYEISQKLFNPQETDQEDEEE
jgi:hypothetical protein